MENFKAFSQELHAHHRLFIWLAALAVAFVIGVKVINYSARVADRNAAIEEKKVEADKDLQHAADVQARADSDKYAAWKTDSDRRVDGLYSQIASLAGQLKAQQDKDRALTPSALADRWNSLIGIPGGVNAGADGLTASLVSSQATVVMLDEVSADRQTIINKTGVIAERDADLVKRQGLLDDAGAQIAACKKEVKDAAEACGKEKAKIRADARKTNVKVFFAGALAVLAAIAGFKHAI
jgi:hypothetical protein